MRRGAEGKFIRKRTVLKKVSTKWPKYKEGMIRGERGGRSTVFNKKGGTTFMEQFTDWEHGSVLNVRR